MALPGLNVFLPLSLTVTLIFVCLAVQQPGTRTPAGVIGHGDNVMGRVHGPQAKAQAAISTDAAQQNAIEPLLVAAIQTVNERHPTAITVA